MACTDSASAETVFDADEAISASHNKPMVCVFVKKCTGGIKKSVTKPIRVMPIDFALAAILIRVMPIDFALTAILIRAMPMDFAPGAILIRAIQMRNYVVPHARPTGQSSGATGKAERK